jgi:hypothetical protein
VKELFQLETPEGTGGLESMLVLVALGIETECDRRTLRQCVEPEAEHELEKAQRVASGGGQGVTGVHAVR